MFDRIRKALSSQAKPQEAGPSTFQHAAMTEWAAQEGLTVTQSDDEMMAVVGQVAGTNPWRLEIGASTRSYIRGEELRCRSDLKLDEDISVVVMNRPLKEALERKAYNMITDTLQTTADPGLPEEMRWLAMYDEVGWDALPAKFWSRYAVMAHRREHAVQWIDPPLAQMLMDWPIPAPSPETPFLIVLLRGKAFLRMEYSPPELSTLQHAAIVFTAACESATGGFSAHIDF
jgi:hypothetical protein